KANVETWTCEISVSNRGQFFVLGEGAGIEYMPPSYVDEDYSATTPLSIKRSHDKYGDGLDPDDNTGLNRFLQASSAIRTARAYVPPATIGGTHDRTRTRRRAG